MNCLISKAIDRTWLFNCKCSDSYDSEFEDRQWFFTDHVDHFQNETFAEHYNDWEELEEENHRQQQSSTSNEDKHQLQPPVVVKNSRPKVNQKLIDFVINNEKVRNRRHNILKLEEDEDTKLNATDLFAYLQNVNENDIPDDLLLLHNSKCEQKNSNPNSFFANGLASEAFPLSPNSLGYSKAQKRFSPLKGLNIFEKLSPLQHQFKEAPGGKRKLFDQVKQRDQFSNATVATATATIPQIILPTVHLFADKENCENYRRPSPTHSHNRQPVQGKFSASPHKYTENLTSKPLNQIKVSHAYTYSILTTTPIICHRPKLKATSSKRKPWV